MKVIRTLKLLILTTCLLSVSAAAQTPYDEGQKALREKQWMAAANQFELAIHSENGDEVDIAAAMYWRAYALYKAGHRGDAARQVAQLEREHDGSRWLNEARALQIEYQGSIEDATEEDELRLFALSRLLERDFDRALPLVIEIMNNTASDSVRQDALFLLGMSENPQAQRAVADAVNDSNDPEMQVHAINILGMSGDADSLDMLDGMYSRSDSNDVRQAILHAYFNAESVDRLQKVLKTETDPSLQKHIIHALGAMEATDALKGIYASLENPENRLAALEAFAIAGDIEILKDVLASETDPELRRIAIQGIAINGDTQSAELIRSLYDQSSSLEEKRTLMEALLIMDDAENLALQIAQNETDPELIELAVHALVMAGSSQGLAGLYGQFTDLNTRRMVLEGMAIMGDSAGVKNILETEKDPELRVAAIHALAMANDEETSQYLAGMYPGTSREAKTAIVESMMMLNDAGGLISLLKKEEDPEMRRQMMEMLSVMDSEEADEYMFEMLESKG